MLASFMESYPSRSESNAKRPPCSNPTYFHILILFFIYKISRCVLVMLQVFDVIWQTYSISRPFLIRFELMLWTDSIISYVELIICKTFKRRLPPHFFVQRRVSEWLRSWSAQAPTGEAGNVVPGCQECQRIYHPSSIRSRFQRDAPNHVKEVCLLM